MKEWRTSASDCTGNQIVVKYLFISTETFKCRLCNRKMQRKGSRQITVVDTPYMQYDIALQIETPYLDCPHSATFPDSVPKKASVNFFL